MEKEAEFRAQTLALKKKRKVANKALAKDRKQSFDDSSDEPEDPEPNDQALDEEGQRKKDAVLTCLQQIGTNDFTELKTVRAPVELVQ